jgi:Ca-activated chloride channel family protein
MSVPFVHYGSPQYLVGLLVVPLLFIFASIVRRRRSRQAVSFTNLDLLAVAAARHRIGWKHYVPLGLLALALALSVAAVARPAVHRVATGHSATVILLADVSGSMQASDVYPERIYAAVSAMHELVAELPKRDKVALVTFSDKVEVVTPPTFDHAAIDTGLDSLRPEGGTALGAGVEEAVKLAVADLSASGEHPAATGFLPAAVVLESDGAQDHGTITPLAAAEFAKAARVRIYAVALGTRGGSIVQGSGIWAARYPVPPDPGVVSMLARESGGEAFDASSAGRLDTIYRSLGSSLQRGSQSTEVTPWFEAGAAMLLLSGIGVARARGAVLP